MFRDLVYTNLVKLVELVLVLVVGYLICFVTSGLLYGNMYIGMAAISIVFYYFGGMIRPYIKALQDKITKNKKKEEK